VPARLVVGRHVEPGDVRQLVRQQRPLDVGHRRQLPVDRVVRLPHLLGQHQGGRRPAEHVRQPDVLGQPLPVERGRRLAEQHDHVDRLPAVEQRDRDQRPVPGQVLGRRVVRRHLEVVETTGSFP
jgi:hypothetical protein